MVGTILQVMAVGCPGREARAITGPQNLLALVGDQNHLAANHPDEFVLGRVPMALARPDTRGQTMQIDPELG